FFGILLISVLEPLIVLMGTISVIPAIKHICFMYLFNFCSCIAGRLKSYFSKIDLTNGLMGSCTLEVVLRVIKLKNIPFSLSIICSFDNLLKSETRNAV